MEKDEPTFHEYAGTLELPYIMDGASRWDRSQIANRLAMAASASWQWAFGAATSGLIIGALIFIIFSFYVFASPVNLGVFFYVFMLLSGLTDGIFTFMQLPRRRAKVTDISFDPAKLTIVISCYNGQEVIGRTIDEAKTHVPANQIIVMNDTSTDDTAKIARAKGARVITNPRNINKAFSVSRAMQFVETPYVMVLDDDTMIGGITIPTSLMDEGYTAVAFNVMPEAEDTFINSLQVFEYRKSMQVGKNFRARTGSIGNVSGAIGLFRTDDLKRQVRMHSGQFGGEDEQRTMLAHLYGTGKGITYSDQTVITKAPANVKQLMRQRSMKWNVSLPEMFTLYWRTLFSTKQHYVLKTEKAYLLYTYMTDPLRMLFFWILISKPSHMVISYLFYLVLTILVWIRTERKDPFWVILVFPFYSLLMSICRFFSHFYWFKIKFDYIFKQKFHRAVTKRKLLLEYSFLIMVLIGLWTTSIWHFTSDMHLLVKIKNSRLEDQSLQFQNTTNNDATISNQGGNQ